jgi:hypothetical protein
MSNTTWAVWALILLAQNFSFTFVSRARNSGSTARHMKAAVLSNGVWFASQIFATSAFMKILSGQFGLGKALFAGAFYTAFTVLGSWSAHKWALRNEKGTAAVGANKRYAQIPIEEWERIKAIVGGYRPTARIDVIPPPIPGQGARI